jgi:hypothetical protein
MRPRLPLALISMLVTSALVATAFVITAVFGVHLRQVQAGQESTSAYTVLEPIRNGNLTVFPVVASKSYSTGEFLTLDEGFRSGEVIVTEYGNVRGLVRGPRPALQHDGAEVNRLVLINNSKRPLLLLAGEIVAGGKQDRVIGKDRIVPPESDPVDLDVFCVEPGRWVARSVNFGASGATYGSTAKGTGVAGGNGAGAPGEVASGTLMVQPSVRAKAMGDKDQGQVWAEVKKQQQSVEVEVREATPALAAPLRSTSSYAMVMENKDVKEKVDAIAKPIEQNYQSLIKQLRDRKAVGVVVAVNGRIVWSDIFASTELLEKYWPKLVRSYASEAIVTRVKAEEVTSAQAQAFLAEMEGRRQTIESEPGIFRQTEIDGDGFKAFALTALLPKTGFDVHVAKMAE